MIFQHSGIRRSPLVAGLAALLTPILVRGCGSSGAPQPNRSVAAAPATSAPVSPTPAATASPSTGAEAPAPSSATPAPPTAPPPSPQSPAAPSPAPETPTPSPTPEHPTPSRPTAPGPAPGPATTQPAPLPPGSLALIHSTATGGRSVALTFDDGPGPATGPILDLLAAHGAKATFCTVGRQVQANPALVRRILAEGHRLCDHTVDHPQPMRTLSHDQQVFEITAAKQMIVQAGGAGTAVRWFRAPGGDFTAENEQIAMADGMRSLSWSVDPRDWSRPGVQAIVANVERTLRPGGVVLLHDGGGDRSQTVAAVRQLLPWLVSQGYRFDFPAA